MTQHCKGDNLYDAGQVGPRVHHKTVSWFSQSEIKIKYTTAAMQ